MSYVRTNKYRFLNDDREMVSWCWEPTIELARIKLEERIGNGETKLIGCTVGEPFQPTQAQKNKKSLAKIEKETGVVKLTVRGHKDFKPELEEYARLDLIARGLEE